MDGVPGDDLLSTGPDQSPGSKVNTVIIDSNMNFFVAQSIPLLAGSPHALTTSHRFS